MYAITDSWKVSLKGESLSSKHPAAASPKPADGG